MNIEPLNEVRAMDLVPFMSFLAALNLTFTDCTTNPSLSFCGHVQLVTKGLDIHK